MKLNRDAHIDFFLERQPTADYQTIRIKAKKVLNSCKTQAQREVAKRYIKIAIHFIENNMENSFYKERIQYLKAIYGENAPVLERLARDI